MKHDIILVNTADQEIGTSSKEEVHRSGLLHRAFSVLIFDRQKRLLLQQRAKGKYHCPGLWTNTCCSHPKPNESVEAAAHRRLQEELGFDCDLVYSHYFIYKAALSNGLIEHELDHVWIGEYEGKIVPNTEEVESYQYLSMEEINEWVKKSPEEFTPWFLILLKHLNQS